MSRILKMSCVLSLALGLATIADAGDRHWDSEKIFDFSPGGPGLVVGPIFEEVRGPIDEAEELAWAKKHVDENDTTIEGKLIKAVKYVYRDQPPAFETYPTTNSLVPIVYMTTEFAPRHSGSFVRVDFNIQASVVPDAGGGFAGVSYALWIKEDGGDGEISNPGEADCGGDDICGYLEQTIYTTWLVASANQQQSTSVSTSNFFRARCRRKFEIQAHLFTIYDTGFLPGYVTVNSGFIGLTSGM